MFAGPMGIRDKKKNNNKGVFHRWQWWVTGGG